MIAGIAAGAFTGGLAAVPPQLCYTDQGLSQPDERDRVAPAMIAGIAAGAFTGGLAAVPPLLCYEPGS